MVPSWKYEEAFCRNLGLISPDEQKRLRRARIAVPGMGGVGGVHLIALARLGVGRFRIADPDCFDVANFNRQYGAEVDTLGLPKASTMASKARQINPDLEIECLDDRITEENVDQFLDGVDLLVDGIDFFSFSARRLLFQRAQQKAIWAVTAAPIGFSTAWLTFDPQGMTFDEYFDLRDDMEPADKFAAFAVGLAPRPTHFSYIDLSYVDHRSGRGPSVGLACHLASGVVAAEAVKILLGRGKLRPVPCYSQFDPYRCKFKCGRMWMGNRNPVQRLKRAVLRRKMVQLGYGKPDEVTPAN